MKRNLIILGSVCLMMSGFFLKTPLSKDATSLVFIFLGTLILWLNVSIDWPSILCLLFLSLIPSISMNDVLKVSFGNNTIMFLIMTFILTYSLSKTSYIKKTAYFFIGSKLAKKSPWHFITLFFLSIIFIGLFISPTILFMVYLPILKEILNVLDIDRKEKLSAMFMMGLVFCCGISSGMTPISHVFPIIAMSLVQKTLNIDISYATYMSFGIVVGMVAFLFMMLIFKFILRPDVKKIENKKMAIKKIEKNKGEEIILTVFIFVLLLWIVPSLIKPFSSSYILNIVNFIEKQTIVFAPMIGVILLCIIQVDKKSLLNFKDAMANGVVWSSIIICSATLALGSFLTNPDIGVSQFLKDSLTPYLTNFNSFILVSLFILWANIQTNLSSNLVTVNLVTNVALIILTKNNLGVNEAALCCLIGMCSSFAFATPPAMPSVAIAISDGYVKSKQMLLYGTLMMFVCFLLAIFVGYPIANIFIK